MASDNDWSLTYPVIAHGLPLFLTYSLYALTKKGVADEMIDRCLNLRFLAISTSRRYCPFELWRNFFMASPKTVPDRAHDFPRKIRSVLRLNLLKRNLLLSDSGNRIFRQERCALLTENEGGY